MSSAQKTAPLIVSCVALIWSTTARTQERVTPAEQRLQEVVVTGSRLLQSPEQATAPVTIVDRMDIERGATDSIAKLLQALPLQNGLTQNTNDSFGDGGARINLHGLSAQRTLVLLNGRRFVFGGIGADDSVDLNAIPLAMIERVEIYAGGASSIYGSDAVAGVINVITRTDFRGAELGGSYRASERGDGMVRAAHAVFGSGTSRGNLLVGLEYVDQSGVLQGARAYSAHTESLTTPNGPAVVTGSFYSSQGLFTVPPDNVLGLPVTDFVLPLYTHVAGTRGAGAGDFRPFDPGTDLFDYAPYLYLQTPSKRGSAWIEARHEWTPSLEAYFEGLFHRGRAEERDLPAGYSSFNTGAAPVDPVTGSQVVPATNFYNPFGTDLVGVFRTFSEIGPSRFVQHTDTYRGLTGLRGTLGSWHWDGAITWARNETDFLQGSQILRALVRQAVGPSGRDAMGRIVCGTPDPTTGIVSPASVIAGCVPLDLFGGQGVDGQSTITREQFGYIARDLHTFGTNQHWLADLALSGPFGTLPAGPVRWSLGAQCRRETANVALDPNFGDGVTGLIFLGVPSRAFSTRELFIETNVPLMKDRPAIEALDATLGARYSHFSAFGDTNSLQGGLHWRVTSRVTLRGSYADVFRAPATFDLFASQFEENRPIGDPCGEEPTAEQQINCARSGVPGGQYEELDGPVRVIYGGNPKLTPEAGSTWTAGVLFNGETPSGWRASLDYWRVSLNDAIDSAVPDATVSACIDAGSADACRLITRATDGTLEQIDTRQTNLSSLAVSGVDFVIGGARQLGFGTLNADLSAVYLAQVKRRIFVAGQEENLAGTFDFGGVSWPRWRAQGTLDWLRGAWRVSYTGHYIQSLTECGDKNLFLFAYLADTDCRKVAARLYHDVSATYRLESGLRVSAAVENVTDRDPPRVNLSFTANTDPSIHPLLGRSWIVGVEYDFR